VVSSVHLQDACPLSLLTFHDNRLHWTRSPRPSCVSTCGGSSFQTEFLRQWVQAGRTRGSVDPAAGHKCLSAM